MSPKRTPAAAPDPNQGGFFDPIPVDNGSTDMHGHHVTWQPGEAIPEGVFPDTESGSPAIHAHEADVAAEALKTKHRHEAQLGKHSPLQRSGSYLELLPGDVLPGFGVVTYGNWEDAKKRARVLEGERLAKLARQPELSAATAKVVGQVASSLDIDTTRPREETITELPDRIAVFAELSDETSFMPATRDEITGGLPVLDSFTHGALHNHFRETALRVAKDVRAAGYPARVAEWHGKRAFQSRVYEEIDLYTNAMESLAKLERLTAVIDDTVNPNLTLKEAVEDRESEEIFAPLVRYAVVREILTGKGDLSLPDFRPMATIERRLYPEIRKPEPETAEALAKARQGEYSDEALTRRNKYTYDVFTEPEATEEVKAYIAYVASQITVKQLRTLLPEATNSELNRLNFHARCLQHIGPPYRQSIENELGEIPRER